MKISGFTFVKNATKLYLPLKECIESVLPIVDEFVVLMSYGEDDDKTEEVLKSIDSDKIKIFYSEWDLNTFRNGTVYAQQTDIAKSYCTGDWLFYIQSDEVVHEDDLTEISAAMKHYHKNDDIQGLTFNYLHFWADYGHYHTSHHWYDREIRIIKNQPQIHSWRDAQSFRIYHDEFTPSTEEYLKKVGTSKLNVAQLQARIFHYGFVRPPRVLTKKVINVAEQVYHGVDESKEKKVLYDFDYGAVGRLALFSQTHPKVMTERIKDFHWAEYINYTSKIDKSKKIKHRYKHERPKDIFLSWIENKILGGRKIGGFNNFNLIEKFKN